MWSACPSKPENNQKAKLTAQPLAFPAQGAFFVGKCMNPEYIIKLGHALRESNEKNFSASDSIMLALTARQN